ncbi:MAG: YbaN family protein [Chromatiales bacterium]|nr:YbaN family protein [Chromatiales bacterium]
MKQAIKHSALLIGGWLSLIAGIIGIVLPLLPTTPFILLAGFCFYRSSPKMHNWLLNHKYLGPMIQQWQRTRTINRRVKVRGILLIIATFTISLLILPISLMGKGLLFALGVVLCIFLALVPESRGRYENSKE